MTPEHVTTDPDCGCKVSTFFERGFCIIIHIEQDDSADVTIEADEVSKDLLFVEPNITPERAVELALIWLETGKGDL